MPATPANIGGAGTGNLNAANAMPHPKPVNVDSKISFMLVYKLPCLVYFFFNLSKSIPSNYLFNHSQPRFVISSSNFEAQYSFTNVPACPSLLFRSNFSIFPFGLRSLIKLSSSSFEISI